MGGKLAIAIGIIAVASFILVAIEFFGNGSSEYPEDPRKVDEEFKNALAGFYTQVYNKQEWR